MGAVGRAAALAVIVFTAAVGGSACSDTSGGAESSGADGANATVVRVVDGDTIIADIDGSQENVRLIGVDTPETVKPNSPVECFGKEASNRTKEVLPEGTPVRLVLDVEERDRYGRLLAYVYRADSGEFINLSLVRDGFANQYTYPPNVAHVDEFRKAAAQARSTGSGLWSACKDDNPFEK